MKITVMTADEQIITLDVDPDESIENVKALLEVETQVGLQQQQLLYNGKEMRNHEKLGGLGVRDGDLIMMVSGAASSAPASDLGFNPDGSAVNPAAFQWHIQRDANLMAQLLQVCESGSVEVGSKPGTLAMLFAQSGFLGLSMIILSVLLTYSSASFFDSEVFIVLAV
ncbi:DNA damage-inducible protein 1 [Dionaea muscipula]